MTQITVEIENNSDADLILSLFKRFNFTKISIKHDIDLMNPFGDELAENELAKRLELADDGGSISFSEFKQKLSQWK